MTTITRDRAPSSSSRRRRPSWRRSTCSSSTSPSPPSAPTFPTPTSVRCPGSSTATPSSSPRCSLWPAASPTATATGGCSSSGWRSSRSRPRRARWRPACGPWWPPGRSRASGRRWSHRPRCRLLLNAWPAERRAKAVGTWASVGAVAAALGPPLGGLLVAAAWQWVFLVNVPIGIVTMVAAARVLRESDIAPIGRPDLLGAAFLVLGVGSLAYALVEVPERGWGATVVVVALVVCGVGSERGRHPLAPPPGARAGPCRAASPRVRAGHGDDAGVLVRIRRHAPGQRAVPHLDLGLVGSGGRPRPRGRAGGRRRRRAVGKSHRGTAGSRTRRDPGRAELHGRCSLVAVAARTIGELLCAACCPVSC